MPDMRTIQNIMPFTMLFFFNGFASGLSLYYFTANVVSIGQMVTIKRFFINEDKIRAKIEDNKSKAKDRTKPSFMERLARGREGSGEEAKGTGAQEERSAFEPQKQVMRTGLWLAALLGVMTCLSLSGCRETKDTAMEVQVVVGLQRTPCFGQCPVYELSVLNTGEATLSVGAFATKPLGDLWRRDCTGRRWTWACGEWSRIWPRTWALTPCRVDTTTPWSWTCRPTSSPSMGTPCTTATGT